MKTKAKPSNVADHKCDLPKQDSRMESETWDCHVCGSAWRRVGSPTWQRILRSSRKWRKGVAALINESPCVCNPPPPDILIGLYGIRCGQCEKPLPSS